MKTVSFKSKLNIINRAMSLLVLFCFLANSIVPPPRVYAQAPILPEPGVMVHQSPAVVPLLLKGIKVDPENPFHFDFIVDTGDVETGLKPVSTKDDIKSESTKLIKYFLAALTTPDEDMWVNLSPGEKDRIIPHAFGQTDMGRDLLAQDYMLKQLSSSLLYPEGELGKKFWQQIYEKAYEDLGSTDIPMDALNKVWIVPERAEVFENEGAAFVGESRLAVLLDRDSSPVDHGLNRATSHEPRVTNILKSIILPAIEKEINEGENFAQLRQIFHSLILATWYKKRLKQSVLGQNYANQNKTEGINVNDPQAKMKIYNQYLEAFKKGVYDYIKEEYDPIAAQVIPRKYFSGGAAMAIGDNALFISPVPQNFKYEDHTKGQLLQIDSAMVVDPSQETIAAFENGDIAGSVTAIKKDPAVLADFPRSQIIFDYPHQLKSQEVIFRAARELLLLKEYLVRYEVSAEDIVKTAGGRFRSVVELLKDLKISEGWQMLDVSKYTGERPQKGPIATALDSLAVSLGQMHSSLRALDRLEMEENMFSPKGPDDLKKDTTHYVDNFRMRAEDFHVFLSEVNELEQRLKEYGGFDTDNRFILDELKMTFEGEKRFEVDEHLDRLEDIYDKLEEVDPRLKRLVGEKINFLKILSDIISDQQIQRNTFESRKLAFAGTVKRVYDQLQSIDVAMMAGYEEPIDFDQITFESLSGHSWEDDKDEIISVITTSFAEYIKDKERMIKDLEDYVRSGIFSKAVMKYKGRIVGYAIGGPIEEYQGNDHFDMNDDLKQSLFVSQNKTFYISGRGILPEFQGHGLGRKLRQHLLDMAKDRGYQHVAALRQQGMAKAEKGVTIIQSLKNWRDSGKTYELSLEMFDRFSALKPLKHSETGYTIERVRAYDWQRVKDEIVAFDKASHPENPRSQGNVEWHFTNPEAIPLILRFNGEIIGYAFGGPAEYYNLKELEDEKLIDHKTETFMLQFLNYHPFFDEIVLEIIREQARLRGYRKVALIFYDEKLANVFIRLGGEYFKSKDRYIATLRTDEAMVGSEDVLAKQQESAEVFVKKDQETVEWLNLPVEEFSKEEEEDNKSLSGKALYINVPLDQSQKLAEYYSKVNRLVADALDDPDQQKATYDDIDDRHMTVANIDVGEYPLQFSVDEIYDEVKKDINENEIGPFEIELIGPHLMPNGVIVFEYKVLAEEFVTLRRLQSERMEQKKKRLDKNRAYVPNIYHGTANRIFRTAPYQDALRKLNEEFKQMREELVEKKVVISVKEARVTVSRNDPEDRGFDAQLRMALFQDDNGMVGAREDERNEFALEIREKLNGEKLKTKNGDVYFLKAEEGKHGKDWGDVYLVRESDGAVSKRDVYTFHVKDLERSRPVLFDTIVLNEVQFGQSAPEDLSSQSFGSKIFKLVSNAVPFGSILKSSLALNRETREMLYEKHYVDSHGDVRRKEDDVLIVDLRGTMDGSQMKISTVFSETLLGKIRRKAGFDDFKISIKISHGRVLEDVAALKWLLENADHKSRQVRAFGYLCTKKSFPEDDSAMMTAPGGVDFNPQGMDLYVHSDGAMVGNQFNFQHSQAININGLTPVIVNITPLNISDLPRFMGNSSFKP